MEIFINQSFVEKHCINTCKLSRPMLAYNINSTPNKDRQIFKIVDIVLCYQLHFEQILLIVLSLDKQDLILSFI